MTLPAASALLQQEAFSRLDGVVGMLVGGGSVQGRQAAVTPHTAFSGHGLYF